MKNLIFLSFVCFFLFSCAKTTQTKNTTIALFIPGIVSGSPVYEMLAEGVTNAVNDFNALQQVQAKSGNVAELAVIEAGTNQAEWASQLTSLAADAHYDLIISSNPSLPEIVEPITQKFPKQKFILLDAYLPNNKNVAALRYNQAEQAYITGYMAALVTGSKMPFANPQKKVGFIAAQEYPILNTVLLPYFTQGAKEADNSVSVDFRIVGNWYDAVKAAEIARLMYNNQVDVILPIAGGASAGVIAEAKELGFYITWFDDDGFEKAPGYIVSSSAIKQKKAAFEMTWDYLHGKTSFGKSITVGIKDGYVDFITDNALYAEIVPENIRAKMQDLINRIKNGTLVLTQ